MASYAPEEKISDSMPLVVETTVGRVELDGRFLTINEDVFFLSKRESMVMTFFLHHTDQVYNRRQITNVVFGLHFVSENVGEALKTLREKVRNPRLIRNTWGGSTSSGYILFTDPKREAAYDKLYHMDGRRKK